MYVCVLSAHALSVHVCASERTLSINGWLSNPHSRPAGPLLLLPSRPPQVQSGVARTGVWWGHTLFDSDVNKPDLMVFAKVGSLPHQHLLERDGLWYLLPPRRQARGGHLLLAGVHVRAPPRGLGRRWQGGAARCFARV